MKKISSNFKILFYICLSGTILSLFGKFFWFASLFEHFIHLYLYSAVLCLFVFILDKNKSYSLMTIILMVANIFFTNCFQKNSNVKFSERKLNIYVHNVLNGNDKYDENIKQIKKLNPDILLLFEVNSEFSDKVLLKLKPQYQYNRIYPSEDNYGWAILSKISVKNIKIREISGIFVYASLYLEKENLHIFSIHFPPPLVPDLWNISNRAMIQLKKEINELEGDILIVGDFNMTQWSSNFKSLIADTKLISYDILSSWPSFLPIFVGLQIDHVLANFYLNIEVHSSLGSDHKALFIK